MTRYSTISSFMLALAVIIGAFGAHALRDTLDPYGLEIYNKASFYHFIHALGSLVVSIMPAASLLSVKTARKVCGLLLVGIVFFSGSLYLLAISGERWLGAITPIGGMSFIVAWLWLGIGLREQSAAK